MIINDRKLKQILKDITKDCSNCPIEGENICKTQPYPEDKCVEVLERWLQEFDIAEALEAGAHIVNDQIVFPPESIGNYTTPCERRNARGEKGFDCDECEYVFTCPYCN